MRILVLAESIRTLKEWVKQCLVGHDLAFSEPRLRATVDGVEFVLRPYDMADTVTGMTFNTVLHVDRIPLQLRGMIRVPRKV
jgi:hypothetical protein